MSSLETLWPWNTQQLQLVCYAVPAALAILWMFTANGSLGKLLDQLLGKMPRTPNIEEKQKFPPTKDEQSMGEIIPLSDLNWKTEEPRKIYKFNPKYFLTMGLQNTNINFITHIDRQYAERIEARKEILRTHPGALACLPNAVPMVEELYTYLVSDYLPNRYPTIFVLNSSKTELHNLVTNDILPLVPLSDPIESLRLLNKTVDEDFLMLLPAPDNDGYSLQASIWCYPVGFTAASKLGLKLRDAHAPVPQYASKLQSSMDRYFARLVPGRVVYRVNWAVATNDNLCEDGEYHLYEGQESSISDDDVDPENAYVRCELQTLFALPKSGGKILSVHLYLYPLKQIKEEGLGEEMCIAIDGLKQGNAPEFHRYKRAPIWAEKVKAYMRS